MTAYRLDAQGNIVPMDPAELPREPSLPPPTRSIHIAWFEAALASLGVLEQVNHAVKLAGPVTEALWRRATEVSMTDPDIVKIAAILKVDLTQVFDKADELRLSKAA
jgi:hypothetical protein